MLLGLEHPHRVDAADFGHRDVGHDDVGVPKNDRRYFCLSAREGVGLSLTKSGAERQNTLTVHQAWAGREAGWPQG